MATVLVVDSEPIVRDVVSAILARQGFHVLQAGTLREADQLCREREGPIDLAIVNDTLADGSAPEVIKRLAGGHPEMRVLRFSAFPRDFLLQEGILAPEEAFLEKPFHTHELLDQVRRVLGSLPADLPANQKRRHGGGRT